MKKSLTLLSLLIASATSPSFAEVQVGFNTRPPSSADNYLVRWCNSDDKGTCIGNQGIWGYPGNLTLTDKTLPTTIKFSYVGSSSGNKPGCDLIHTFEKQEDKEKSKIYLLNITGEQDNCTMTIL